MGWTGIPFNNVPKSKEGRSYLARLTLSGYKVLHSKLVKDNSVDPKNGYVYYASLENADGQRYIAIVLMQYEDNEYFYKIMDESVAPYYYDCPPAVLNDVPCPEHEWAVEWRKKVREKIAAERKRHAKNRALKPGDIIEFTNTNYNGYKRFKVVSTGRRTIFNNGHGNYRLENWRKYDFKLCKAL